MAPLLCPGSWSRPGFGVLFDGIGSVREQQLDQLDATPPACPSKWCALQQMVADVELRSRIEEHRRKCNAFLRGDVLARAGDAVEDCQSEGLRRIHSTSEIGIATLE